jgi:amidohydrolase
MQNIHFLKEAKSLLEQMRAIRRDLHKHPELGMQEVRTSRIVADFLTNLGLEVKTGVGGTGVVALLSGRPDGASVALRADMDALEMEEKNEVPYTSIEPGIAHCCGHDGHTAILLGTAVLLCKYADSLNGNVKFIFQPSEDRAPGGALPMIKGGALKDPDVGGIFSLHLNPDLPEGSVGVKSGFATISSAGFALEMIGKGCHVASPHEGVDPVAMAGSVMTAAQTIVSRKINPLDPTIISFCTIHGGTAGNIIPDKVNLTGSIRTLDPVEREVLANELHRIARGVATAGGGKCDFKVNMEYPSVFNHPELTEEFKQSALELLAAESVMSLPFPSMTGEDVSYFHQQIPGVHWLLGIANPAKGFTHPLHSPVFDFNEEIMSLGAALHARCAVDFLMNRQKRSLSGSAA